MFNRRSSYIKTNKVDPEIFIEGNDYNNSQLLHELDSYKDFSSYLVTKYERRIDLISKDIYNDKSYSWILLYINKIKNDDIIKGLKLKYIPQSKLAALINGI